jgi:hypothetical protein
VPPDVVPPAFAPPGPPGDAPAAVTIRTLAGPTAWSGQVLLLAATAPNARCTLTLAMDGGSIVLTRTATADASGTVFWLWTAPEDAAAGAVSAEVRCGGAPSRVNLGDL